VTDKAASDPFRLGVDIVWKVLAAGLARLAVAGYLIHVNVGYSRHGTAADAEVVDPGGPHEDPTARFPVSSHIPGHRSARGSRPRIGTGEQANGSRWSTTSVIRRGRERGDWWYWGFPAGLTVVGLAIPACVTWTFLRRRRLSRL
jgi:hypothetical protein